jgi:XTP/dITP diphosphohydrolase
MLSHEGARVKIICSMGYYDGQTTHIVDGVMEGTITSPREGDGFGFDFVLIPDGYDKTMAELGIEIKNTMSHRFKTATRMAELLK